MVPCRKCHKEMRPITNSIGTVWVSQCRCKFLPTPKAPQNRITRNQKLAIRLGKFKSIPWWKRPEWAQIQ